MKKFLALLIITLFSAPCFAFQNYMLLTDRTVSNVEVKNPEIVEVKIIDSNVFNEQSMLVIPKQNGATCIKFCKGHRKIKLWVKVCDNVTAIKKRDGIKTLPVDLPEELK